MRPQPLQFIGELREFQDRLGRAASAVEERLKSTRMRRHAPEPVGNPPEPELEPPSWLAAEAGERIPNPPMELLENTRRVIEESDPGQGSVRAASDGTPVVLDAPPRSLVHRRVVVGNRRRIALLALVRVKVEVDGETGVSSLFPGFDAGQWAAFEVEVSLHRVSEADRDEGEGTGTGLEIGSLLPGLVSEGWTYRALPWVASVREGLVRGLSLPSAFTAVPANGRPPEPAGVVAGGDAFVVLALDPESGEGRVERGDGREGSVPEDHGDARAEAGKDESAGPPPGELAGGMDPASGKDASDASAKDGGPDPGRLTDSRALPEWVMERVRAAWREFVQARPGGLEPGEADLRSDFPEFLARRLPEAVSEVELRPPVEVPQIRFDPAVLAKKFKHAPDFGVHERFSDRALARFAEALSAHFSEASDVHVVKYTGRRLLAHVSRGRLVWTTTDGFFVNGYLARPDQLVHVWAQPEWNGT